MMNESDLRINIQRDILENCINDYIDIMIDQTDFSIKEAQEITQRDCEIFIERYEE